MFQPSLSLIPVLHVFPASSIGDAILKHISKLLVQRRLVVLGNQHILA
jgi:hypothetical protein